MERTRMHSCAMALQVARGQGTVKLDPQPSRARRSVHSATPASTGIAR